MATNEKAPAPKHVVSGHVSSSRSITTSSVGEYRSYTEREGGSEETAVAALRGRDYPGHVAVR
jgi:hypothetical protein